MNTTSISLLPQIDKNMYEKNSYSNTVKPLYSKRQQDPPKSVRYMEVLH